MTEYQRGMYLMFCFNGLDGGQQLRLVYHGNLEWGYQPMGRCHNPAQVEVTTVWDEMPGPRFYCIDCAIQYLINMKGHHDAGDSDGITSDADHGQVAVHSGGDRTVHPGDLQRAQGDDVPTTPSETPS